MFKAKTNPLESLATMDNETQLRWDARYRDATQPNSPSKVLAENTHLLPAQGIALDLACGLGGNALLLAQSNLTCHAWDISPIAIQKLNAFAKERCLPVVAQARDINAQALQPNSFDVIIVAHFLERSFTQPLINALRPNGLLFYQTFTHTRVTDAGPSQPQWRLHDQELLTMFAPLKVLVYREEGLVGNINQGFRDEALLVAIKN